MNVKGGGVDRFKASLFYVDVQEERQPWICVCVGGGGGRPVYGVSVLCRCASRETALGVNVRGPGGLAGLWRLCSMQMCKRRDSSVSEYKGAGQWTGLWRLCSVYSSTMCKRRDSPGSECKVGSGRPVYGVSVLYRCARGETALDLDLNGVPRGNCTG